MIERDDPRLESPEDGALAGRVHSGVKWTALSLVAFRLGRFLTQVVLARILTKEMFGVVTMALAFITAFQALRDVGFGQAYVQRQGLSPAEDRRAASTVFWVAGAVNALMFAVGYALAPSAAAAFPKLDGLEPVLRATFCLLLIEAVSTTPSAVLQKRLEFGRIATSEMVGVVTNALFSIGLAIGGAEEWSLVLGTLGARACQTATVVRFARWRPTLEFDTGIARDLFGFGKYMWGTSLLSASNNVIDRMLLGRISGDAALGVYGNSHNLCTVASKPLYSIVLRVAFPAMSRVQDDLATLRRGFLRASSAIALLTIPLAVGLALVAHDFVWVVYGAPWVPMAPIVEVLAAYGFFTSLGAVSGPVLLATGRPRALFFFTLLGQAVLVGMLLYCVSLGVSEERGGLRIAWAVLIAAGLSECAAYAWAARRIELGAREALEPVLRCAASALAMGALVVGVQQLVGADAHPALRLSLCIAGGVVAYVAASLVVNGRGLRATAADLGRVAGSGRA